MKTRVLLLALLFGSLGTFAQTNFDGFRYQAVGLQAIIQVGPSDQFVETHTASTDDFGLVSIVGQGTPSGSSALAAFGDIDRASGQDITYTVNVDVSGGTTLCAVEHRAGQGRALCVPCTDQRQRHHVTRVQGYCATSPAHASLLN